MAARANASGVAIDAPLPCREEQKPHYNSKTERNQYSIHMSCLSS